MNSTLRDFLILLLVTGGLFAVIYGWIAYSSDSADETEEKQQKESLIGEEMKERFAKAFEEQLNFIENDYTQQFEDELNRRFQPHLDSGTVLKDIHVINRSQVNAFTTVGDRIYLFKGLITALDDPGMVAAVVAHELGHIHHNHVEDRLKMDIGSSLLASILTGGNQGMIIELGRTMMGLTFSRSQEQEADEFALNLLEQAGIHPQNLSRAFLRMKSLAGTGSESIPSFLSTHPSLDERIERILEYEVSEDFSEQLFEIAWDDFTASLK